MYFTTFIFLFARHLIWTHRRRNPSIITVHDHQIIKCHTNRHAPWCMSGIRRRSFICWEKKSIPRGPFCDYFNMWYMILWTCSCEDVRFYVIPPGLGRVNISLPTPHPVDSRRLSYMILGNAITAVCSICHTARNSISFLQCIMLNVLSLCTDTILDVSSIFFLWAECS